MMMIYFCAMMMMISEWASRLGGCFGSWDYFGAACVHTPTSCGVRWQYVDAPCKYVDQLQCAKIIMLEIVCLNTIYNIHKMFVDVPMFEVYLIYKSTTTIDCFMQNHCQTWYLTPKICTRFEILRNNLHIFQTPTLKQVSELDIPTD